MRVNNVCSPAHWLLRCWIACSTIAALFPHAILVPTDNALFEHRGDQRGQHVVRRADAAPGQGIQGFVDAGFHVRWRCHFKCSLQDVLDFRDCHVPDIAVQGHPCIGAFQYLRRTARVNLGGVDVGVEADGIEQLGLAHDRVNRHNVQVHSGQRAFLDVVDQRVFQVAARVRRVRLAELHPRQEVLAHRGHDLQRVGEAVAGHAWSRETLFEQPGKTVTNVGQDGTRRCGSERDVIHHANLTCVGILDHDPDTRCEHQQVDQD